MLKRSAREWMGVRIKAILIASRRRSPDSERPALEGSASVTSRDLAEALASGVWLGITGIRSRHGYFDPIRFTHIQNTLSARQEWIQSPSQVLAPKARTGSNQHRETDGRSGGTAGSRKIYDAGASKRASYPYFPFDG